MASGVVYLVNFPSGKQTALNRIGGGPPNLGAEIAPGWIINRIELAQPDTHTEDGLPISFEVWVEGRPAP